MAGTEFPDGGMRLFGLIGDPVAQVRACFPATELMRSQGANAALLPLHVPSAHLPDIFRSLRLLGNFDGMVITVPHKIPMAGLVDTVSDRAALVGAINLARREADGALAWRHRRRGWVPPRAGYHRVRPGGPDGLHRRGRRRRLGGGGGIGPVGRQAAALRRGSGACHIARAAPAAGGLRRHRGG